MQHLRMLHQAEQLFRLQLQLTDGHRLDGWQTHLSRVQGLRRDKWWGCDANRGLIMPRRCHPLKQV